jgi:phage-related protein
VTSWTVHTLDGIVDSELGALPPDMRARFTRICSLIEAFGLSAMGMPHVRHVDGPVWEMRLSGRAGIARALSVVMGRRRVVVVRVFVKKTQRTPSSEVALAIERVRRLAP